MSLFTPNTNPSSLSPAANPVGGNTSGSLNGGISGENAGRAVSNNRVVVNLHANVRVQGDIDLISSSGELLNDVVICQVDLSASALYSDASSGVIEFWEPSGAVGAVVACISAAGKTGGDGNAAQMEGFDAHAADLSGGLNAVINGGQNALSAAPFNSAYYANVAEYQVYASFGDLVLALYSHYMFGHVAATGAIDNDAALVAYMNSDAAGDAQIASGLTTALRAITASVAKSIAAQVLSQDPSRAAGRDNNALQNEHHQALLFAPGDVVYVQITVDAPTVSVGQNPANVASPGSDATNLPNPSTLPQQSTGNSLNAEGAPGALPNNLVGAAYPTVAPTFALQITLA